MSGKLTFKVYLFMMPQDLREIADRMQARAEESRPGRTLTVKTWYGKDGLEVDFVLDQDRARKEGLLKD